MLNNISWASYALAISIIVIIYYTFVLVLFYSRELQNIFVKNPKNRNHSALSTASLLTQENGIDVNDKKTAEDQTALLPELLVALKKLISTGIINNYPKEEILMSLKLQLQQYPSLNNPRQQVNINQYISTAFESICSIHLSEEEISALWIK